ncbi:hypothetical protein SAMN05444359_107153 [Neolewinella agarilytica]|uniref:Uncharacterized protein n=1 Tax=Neolewinella agarilytica TaxID=478744 RepID=A0A1H9EPG9_9BACT|nr:hypothetical protein SAMN05444359_107153 [Neolewinella agarilytica]
MYLLQFSDGEKRYLGRFLCAGPQVLWEFFEQQGEGMMRSLRVVGFLPCAMGSLRAVGPSVSHRYGRRPFRD